MKKLQRIKITAHLLSRLGEPSSFGASASELANVQTLLSANLKLFNKYLFISRMQRQTNSCDELCRSPSMSQVRERTFFLQVRSSTKHQKLFRLDHSGGSQNSQPVVFVIFPPIITRDEAQFSQRQRRFFVASQTQERERDPMPDTPFFQRPTTICVSDIFKSPKMYERRKGKEREPWDNQKKNLI